MYFSNKKYKVFSKKRQASEKSSETDNMAHLHEFDGNLWRFLLRHRNKRRLQGIVYFTTYWWSMLDK